MDKKPHRATGRPRGRPRKYPLPALAEASVNPPPASFDARAILRSIASDPSLPAQSRVAACKTLLVEKQFVFLTAQSFRDYVARCSDMMSPG
jgi:hypothetical protein